LVGALTSETVNAREVQRDAFGHSGDPLLALFDELTQQMGSAMAVAYRAEPEWVDGVRAALWELLTCLDANPVLARFLVVGSRVGGLRVLARRGHVLDVLSSALEANSPSKRAGVPSVPFGAVAVVDAVASVLHARLAHDPALELCELCGSLMGMIVLPYLGAEAAREELLRSQSGCAVGAAGELQ
jgi:hypothetical protein